MATEIIPSSSRPDFVAELLNKSTPHLRQLLAEQLRLTADHLLRLAWIVRVLEERGEDLSDLRHGILPYLRQIAYGQVLAEAVVRFSSFPLLLGKVAALPEPDQRRLAAGEPVRLVVSAPDAAGFTHRLVDPTRLTRDQVSQVFGKAHLRPDAEQIARLEDRRLRPVARGEAPARGKARADHERGGITVHRTFVPQADVVLALGDLRGDALAEAPGDDRVTLVVPLTPEEHRALKVKAAQGDTNMTDLARAALRAAGLI